MSESGIHDENDIRELKKLGIQAVLVGSALMSSDNLFKKTKELVEACNGPSLESRLEGYS